MIHFCYLSNFFLENATKDRSVFKMVWSLGIPRLANPLRYTGRNHFSSVSFEFQNSNCIRPCWGKLWQVDRRRRHTGNGTNFPFVEEVLADQLHIRLLLCCNQVTRVRVFYDTSRHSLKAFVFFLFFSSSAKLKNRELLCDRHMIGSVCRKLIQNRHVMGGLQRKQNVLLRGLSPYVNSTGIMAAYAYQSFTRI